MQESRSKEEVFLWRFGCSIQSGPILDPGYFKWLTCLLQKYKDIGSKSIQSCFWAICFRFPDSFHVNFTKPVRN